MAFKVRGKSTEPGDIRRTLNRTELNQSDPPLYQVINEVITRLEIDRDSIDNKFGKDDKINATTQINGIVPINNGGTITGEYIPIKTLVTNLLSLGSNQLYFYRIGELVTVFGYLAINITASGVNTEGLIQLPILSYFDHSWECSGIGHSDTVNQTISIQADPVTSQAKLKFLSSTTGLADYYINFSYKIIAQ